MNGNLGIPFRFSEEDLKLFSDASGDRNPLHTSAFHASRTAYGEQVVFGALGALVCLPALEIPSGQAICRLTADFHRPMFLGVEYQITSPTKANQEPGSVVRLLDGTVPVLTLSAEFHGVDKAGERSAASGPVFERSEPRSWQETDLRTGLSVEGRWRADPPALAALCKRWGIEIDPFVAETLLWGSYLIGMEIPGRDALFFRFSLDFRATSAPAGPLMYRATVQSVKPGMSQLRIGVVLSSRDGQLASGQFLSFVRPEISQDDVSELTAGISGSDALRGKVGLVIGASRGLGAATAAVMSLHGAEVLAVSRSFGVNFGASRITATSGDAANLHWLGELRAQIRAKQGRLDYLVCNAFPTIPALRLEPNGFSRISSYLGRAVDMVLAPLCAFLELLNESAGCAVIISSAAVEKPVREWPHYVAAKNAVEALGRTAPMQYPQVRSLIVRPERLLTEMTNTPMGRQNALPPSQMAAQIVERMKNPPAPGTTEVMRAADKIRESRDPKAVPQT